MRKEEQDKLIKTAKNTFIESYKGKIPNKIITESAESIDKLLNGANETYSVTVTTESFVFYTYVTVEWDGAGKQFTKKLIGNAGGVGIGGGKTSGVMYINNDLSLEDLYEKTKSFQVTTTIAIANINIYDENHNPIAHVIAGGAQIGSFLGGGTASWE